MHGLFTAECRMTEFQLQPMPQVVLRLDRAGLVLDIEKAVAGPRLQGLNWLRGRNVHRCLHPKCKDDGCDLRAMLHSALKQIEKARILEWEHQSRPSGLTLRLHLRRAPRRAKTWATLTVTDITDARLWSGTMRDAHEALSGLMARPAAERASLAGDVDRKLRNMSGELIIAQEIERRRIAADMHDGLGQWLSMAKLSIETGLARRAGVAAAEDYQRAIEHIEHAIREVRAIARNLRPSPLDEFGLVPTLELLCHALQQAQPQIALSFEVQGELTSVPQAQAVAMTRILQESLNNLAKHAGASKAVVSIDFAAERTILSVCDNGQGFDALARTAPGTAAGYGLTSMHDRMEKTHGQLRISSEPGRGTEIVATWERDRSRQ